MNEYISDPFYQKLYRLFCWLSNGSAGIRPAHASFLIEETHRLAGRPSTSKNLSFNGEEVSFRELLGLLENLMNDRKELECATATVFDRYISQIIRKGFLLYRARHSQKGCISRKREKWQNAWFSIEPGTINLWKLHGRDVTGRRIIKLDTDFRIESLIHDGDLFICRLEFASTSFELAHLDWNSARLLENSIHIAASFRTKEQLFEFDRKTATRFHGCEAEVEEERRIHLEKEKRKLEVQLEKERRALKDEEIVRGLATRMLEEERLKSEQMEKVLHELQTKLQAKQEEQEELDVLEEELREYTNEIEYRDDRESLLPEDNVWKKEDFLIISTQSI